jgi:hypothetical protein
MKGVKMEESFSSNHSQFNGNKWSVFIIIRSLKFPIPILQTFKSILL